MAYKRAALAERVVQALARVRPRWMYLAFDGPRPGEEAVCAATRDAVVSAVDWPCEVRTLVRSQNLGCRAAVTGAIDWLLDEQPAGVILEDDTLPTSSFLHYAAELLELYQADTRIGMISGTNLVGRWPSSSSYFFGDGGVWGWATWRRAWTPCDPSFSIWDDLEARNRARAFYGRAEWRRLRPAFEAVRRSEIDTWDYQWSFIRASRGQLSAIPSVNLVTNVGFGSDATHTFDPASRLSQIMTGALEVPLAHPAAMAFERSYQRAARVVQSPTRATTVRRAVRRLVNT